VLHGIGFFELLTNMSENFAQILLKFCSDSSQAGSEDASFGSNSKCHLTIVHSSSMLRFFNAKDAGCFLPWPSSTQVDFTLSAHIMICYDNNADGIVRCLTILGWLMTW
jgi:hypothetical protein